MNITQGQIVGVDFQDTPNHDERPNGSIINAIVIHNISLPPGDWRKQYIDDFFRNRLDMDAHPYFKSLQGQLVSAHVLIDRVGELTQYVNFHHRAWHAGNSQLLGKDNCNDFSIGIELIGCDDIAYTPEQYKVLAGLTKSLMLVYPEISMDRIVGHNDIAPGRKTDPGPAFDWSHYRALINSMV